MCVCSGINDEQNVERRFPFAPVLRYSLRTFLFGLGKHQLVVVVVNFLLGVVRFVKGSSAGEDG